MVSSNNSQGELWGTAPEDWALYLEITFIPLYKKIISRVGLNAAHNILDIGCGSGLFMKMAGVKAGTSTGIDISGELLQIAKQRNPSAVFVNQDMEQLSFAENSFDLVTGFNSLQYAQNIPGLFRKIKNVLKAEGKLAIGVWGSPEECESLRVLASVASLLPAAAPGTPGPLALSGDDHIESLLNGAGLRVIEKGTIDCPWNFSSLDEALKGILSAGPSAEAINYAGKEKVREQLVATLKAFNFVDEVYVLENVFHYIIAGKA